MKYIYAMVKLKDGIGVWPSYSFTYVLDANDKPFGEFKTYVPVDEGYFILLSRKYYYARNSANPGMDVFARFYEDVIGIALDYDPDEWCVARGSRNVLKPKNFNYLD